ncbi:DUF6879 family protein [Actinocatenispora comari]|jgi:hypothetical protein|uniref:DUF6879 domain-containing protein n=1 Tax=Actinocatenispora comari TaxID=2807577 RepID=A0A8J4A7J0_9ACTN|nr:DUF6879 family protein [Actinocatenispora comari]GIL25723.1 hypothetical protein NUM_09770 [Actinocatenispora comari]
MRPLTDEDFARSLATFSHTAFRLELQPVYSEPSEHDTVAKFVSGEPEVPTTVEGLRQWFAQVSEQTAAGKRIERVRVQEDPPTDYQRWERWIGAWNIKAGETLRYMTRATAHGVGLLPAAGDRDWWLLDSDRLIVMYFDDAGHRIRNELITDPEAVVQACAWRDLAVHYSVPDQVRDIAA